MALISPFVNSCFVPLPVFVSTNTNGNKDAKYGSVSGRWKAEGRGCYVACSQIFNEWFVCPWKHIHKQMIVILERTENNVQKRPQTWQTNLRDNKKYKKKAWKILYTICWMLQRGNQMENAQKFSIDKNTTEKSVFIRYSLCSVDSNVK